jgi:hypothetical protein
MNLDVKGLLAVVIVVLSFLLVALDVYVRIFVRGGETLDPAVIGISSGAIFGVVAFYFGHANGTVTALAQSAAALSQTAVQLNAQSSEILTRAAQRRVGDPSSGIAPSSASPITAG